LLNEYIDVVGDTASVSEDDEDNEDVSKRARDGFAESIDLGLFRRLGSRMTL
jgi:hypothetical protein